MIKFQVRCGLEGSDEWVAFCISPPIGYTVEEWNRKYPNGRVLIPHEVIEDEGVQFLADMLADTLGHDKFSPPSPKDVMARKRKAEEEGDEEFFIRPSTAKKRRISARSNCSQRTRKVELRTFLTLFFRARRNRSVRKFPR